jgi:hypothetical protein
MIRQRLPSLDGTHQNGPPFVANLNSFLALTQKILRYKTVINGLTMSNVTDNKV